VILNIRGICFSYKSDEVLSDITFSLREQEILAILGPNGSGKSTLLKCMNAILRPGTGTVLLDNTDIRKMKGRQIARRIGYVPQRSESSRMTAFDSILLGRMPYIRWRPEERDINVVNAAIEKLGLTKLALRHINEMSGGELQKVSIARALVQEPKILLLDEPTSSLDLRNQVYILKLIREIVTGHRLAGVMTMHDLNMALRYADRFIFLKDGSIYAAVNRNEITPEIIEAVYGLAVSVEHHRNEVIIIPEE